MEAQGGGGGGGEVRRLHIIYFLSRKGRIEHPHLIRVHHLSRNGVRLRDVKRWLSELRGKDMPESFAWSYKRKYKTGYVWQDLLDEDLITPISDNEYVLKGSEIPSANFGNADVRSHGKKKVSVQKELPSDQTDARDNPKLSQKEEHPETIMDALTKSSPEIEEELLPFGSDTSTSTLTDDSMKLEEDHSEANKQESQEQSNKFENPSSFYSTLLNKKKNKNSNAKNPSTRASSSFAKSKSYSSGASNMFRNFISCGAVETNDSAMLTINRRERPEDNSSNKTAEICKGDNLGGSERISWNQPQPHDQLNVRRRSCDGVETWNNNKSEFNNQKPVSAAYKPVNGPNCSSFPDFSSSVRRKSEKNTGDVKQAMRKDVEARENEHTTTLSSPVE